MEALEVSVRRRVVLWLVDIENTPHMRNIGDRPPERHVYAKPITARRTDSTKGALTGEPHAAALALARRQGQALRQERLRGCSVVSAGLVCLTRGFKYVSDKIK